MGNARFVFVLAAALVGSGCATSGARPAEAPAQAKLAAGTDEVRFMGHRLVVQRDGQGKVTSAKAWDPKEKAIPAHIIPFEEVEVCLPKHPEHAAGAARYCERFSFIADGTSFKTGANSICWFYYNRQLVYYQC